MEFKSPTDRTLVIGEHVLTIVDRATTNPSSIAHVCEVVSFRGPTDDRVDVAPVCGGRAGVSSPVSSARVCARCVAAIDREEAAARGLVWDEVITGSTEGRVFRLVG